MNTNNISLLLYELSNLNRVPRSGLYQFLYEDFESIAAHSFKVAVIAYFLARMMNLETGEVLLMALFHDCEETRTGDSNQIQKSYLNQDEEKAFSDQIKGIDAKLTEELIAMREKYKAKESEAAKVVKDSDYIEYFMSLKILSMKGNKEAMERIKYEMKNLDFMYTKVGKEVLKRVLETDPNEWTRSNHKGTMKNTVRKKTKKK